MNGVLVHMMAKFVPAAAIWEVSKRTSAEMGKYLLGDHLEFLLGTGISLGKFESEYHFCDGGPELMLSWSKVRRGLSFSRAWLSIEKTWL